jgi:hypothetical protein
VVEVIAKYQVIAIYVLRQREFKSNAVLVFVLVVGRKVEIRRGTRRVLWQTAV